MVTNTTRAFGKLILILPATNRTKELWVTNASSIIGRSRTSDLVLDGPNVSLAHARLECDYAGCIITDLGSRGGTRINGFPVERARIVPGDTIEMGETSLRFEGQPQLLTSGTASAGAATYDSESDAVDSVRLLPARLAVRMQGRTWETPLKQDVTIGRDLSNDIVIDDPTVSRHHALVERVGNDFLLRDLRSERGTWLHGERVVHHFLEYGDNFRIGSARLVFLRSSPSESAVKTVVKGVKPGRRPVVVVPGIMGSELWAGQERVWPNVRHFFRDPESFSYPNALRVGDPVSEMVVVPNLLKVEGYGRLTQFLQRNLGYRKGVDLLEFSYDWRQDSRRSAMQLADTIDHWKTDSPVTIVAHSAGCLVSRYYVQRLGGNKKVERMILIGGPNYGTAKAMAGLLLGKGLLPFDLMGERLRKILATFPSIYQFLPSYPAVFDQRGNPIDLFQDETWLPEAQRPLLRDAAEFFRELGYTCGVPCISVFGYGFKTITKAIVVRNGQGVWDRVDFVAEDSGDNTIPEASAVAEGSEIQPVRQHHSTLYADKDVKVRLQFELVKGSKWHHHRLPRRQRGDALVPRRRMLRRL